MEHVNITVTNPDETAERLIRWFGWHVRWAGAAKNNGRTVHVGNETSYIALYSSGNTQASKENSYASRAGLNHIGIVVPNLDQTEKLVIADGYHPHNHADYEPGRRFYFTDEDEIEFEVVSYAS